MFMSKTVAFVSAFCVMALVSSDVLASTRCWTTGQLRAQKVRELQTKMMVGALQCRDNPELKIIDNYNEFIRKFKGEIGRQNSVLRARFGASGYDRHTTRMANSWTVVGDKTAFCQDVSGLAVQSIALKPTQLANFAETSIAETSVPTTPCPVKKAAAKKSSKKKRK
jgi:hypothetical protein